MKRGLVWSVTLPLAVIGSQVAHALDYRIIAPNADERAHLLAETGHRYIAYLPLGLALATVIVVLALVAEARHRGPRQSRGLKVWGFGLMAPLVFTCQELFERLAHDGRLSIGVLLQSTFVVGLALQIPFALVAFATAWLLLRAARAVGALFRGTPSVRLRNRLPLVLAPSRRSDTPRLPALALGFGTRGPPAPSL